MWSSKRTENKESMFDSSMILKYPADFGSIGFSGGEKDGCLDMGVMEDGCLDNGAIENSNFGGMMNFDGLRPPTVVFPAGV